MRRIPKYFSLKKVRVRNDNAGAKRETETNKGLGKSGHRKNDGLLQNCFSCILEY